MSAQIQKSLFDISPFYSEMEAKPKRNRFDAWENFYTVYMYDFTAYHTFCTHLRLVKEKFPNDFLTFGLFYTTGKYNLLLAFYALFMYKFERKDEPIFRGFFYVLDGDGKRKPLGDEKHIFRYKTLHKIQEKIYEHLGINPFLKFEVRCQNGIILWGNERMAEIPGTRDLPIVDRVLLHIRLLRLLRKGEVRV